MLWQIIAEPETSLRTGRFAPRIPSMVAVVLASRIQAVDGDDTSRVSRACESEGQTYSTLAALFAVLSTFGSGYSCRRGFVAHTIKIRDEYRVLDLPF